ncbi:unannotated protein [freshwater metagenome]|uniref:Unannotated protein n=1 Tax=freshwater metagenome TaxID=449393 RepID=A0A6J6EWF4_9ZZZZ
MLTQHGCAFKWHVGRIVVNCLELGINHAEHVGCFHGRYESWVGAIGRGGRRRYRLVDLPAEQRTIGRVNGEKVAERCCSRAGQTNEKDW